MKILFICVLVCISCVSQADRDQQSGRKENADGTVEIDTFLALGDSYTIGESVGDSERWPEQLADTLKSRGVAIRRVDIIAETGWTTGELISGIEKTGNCSNYDLVSLLIGVNNQYREMDIAIFERDFKKLIKRSIRFASGDRSRVFILSIPDWGVTPFAQGREREKIRREIDRYNMIKERIAAEYGVQFFNITHISREAENDNSLVAEDGLHPSAKMYSLWAEKIADSLSCMRGAWNE
mgnify:CR=1 FL=1